MQRTKSKVNSTKRAKEKARQTLNIKTSRDILSISGSEDIQMTSIPRNVRSPSPDAPSLVSSPQSSFLLPFGPYSPQDKVISPGNSTSVLPHPFLFAEHQAGSKVLFHPPQYQTGLTTMMHTLISQVSSLTKEVKDLKKKRKKEHYDRALSESSDDLSLSSSFTSPIPTPNPTPVLTCKSSEDVLCVLGDPNLKDRCVVIGGFSQLAVKAKENASTDAYQLALKLMDVFFAKEELLAGNCTEAEGRELLRQDVIDGIRLHIDYKYPMMTKELELKRWGIILHKNMNFKCRNIKAMKKKICN